MCGTKHLLVDRQRALEERPCCRKLALGHKHGGKGIKA
jgi:hypothetical protein